MSQFCIHEMKTSGTLYEPPESWCDMGYNDCNDCPYNYSQSDYEDNLADYKYETYRSLFDF